MTETPEGMVAQGGLASVGLDKKTKRRRPTIPMGGVQPPMDPMQDPQNPLAMMASQRPMLGTDPNDLKKKEMMNGR